MLQSRIAIVSCKSSDESDFPQIGRGNHTPEVRLCLRCACESEEGRRRLRQRTTSSALMPKWLVVVPTNRRAQCRHQHVSGSRIAIGTMWAPDSAMAAYRLVHIGLGPILP